jgi:hypothetical protein
MLMACGLAAATPHAPPGDSQTVRLASYHVDGKVVRSTEIPTAEFMSVAAAFKPAA